MSAPVNSLFAGNTITHEYNTTTSSGDYTVPFDKLQDKQIHHADIKYTTSTGSTTSGMTGNYSGYYWHYYEPYKTYYYPMYNNIPAPDKFEVAFKLAKKLMEKKLIKPLKTVEDFFGLMDSIVEAL